MNKTELIAAIAERAEISKKDSEKAVKAFIDVVTEELKKEEKVQLVGGEPMTISACNAPKFKAGKALKDAVN